MVSPLVGFVKVYWLQIVFLAVLGYLVGSINFGIIVTRTLKNLDIRAVGSKNAGFTNVYRVAGPKAAVLTMIGDVGKGLMVCLIGEHIFYNLPYPGVVPYCISRYGIFIAGIFCMIGHVYPCYFNFKGGKAILCTLAMLLVADYRIALILLTIFLIVLFASKIVSLASIIGIACYPIVNLFVTFLYDYLMCGKQITIEYVAISTTVAIFVSIFVIYKHSSNIHRLINKTESKIIK